MENNSAESHDKHCLSEIIDFSSSNDTCDYDTCTEQTDTSSNQLLSEHIRIRALQHQCTQPCINDLLKILTSHGQIHKQSWAHQIKFIP